MCPLASLSWPWEPLSEDEYDAEEYDTADERWERERNRSIEPQMEPWRPER